MAYPNIKEKCDKSDELPAEVTTEAQRTKDEYGFIQGTTGKGRCGGCGRIIGLSSTGKLVAHSFRDPAVRRKAEVAEREAERNRRFAPETRV